MKRILTFLLLSFLTFNIFSKEIKILNIKVNELDKIEFMNCTSMDFINGYLTLIDFAIIITIIYVFFFFYSIN